MLIRFSLENRFFFKNFSCNSQWISASTYMVKNNLSFSPILYPTFTDPKASTWHRETPIRSSDRCTRAVLIRWPTWFSKRIARIEVEARDYIATNRGGRLSGCDTRSARLASSQSSRESIKSRFVGVPRVLCLFRAKTIKGCRGSLSLHENTRSSHIYFVPLKLFSARKIEVVRSTRFAFTVD